MSICSLSGISSSKKAKLATAPLGSTTMNEEAMMEVRARRIKDQITLPKHICAYPLCVPHFNANLNKY